MSYSETYGHPPVPSDRVIAATKQLASIIVASGEDRQEIPVSSIALPPDTADYVYGQVAQIVTDDWRNDPQSPYDWLVAHDPARCIFLAIRQHTVVPNMMRLNDLH